MYSKLILVILIIVGGGWVGFHYLTSTFLTSNPASKKKDVNYLFGLPMLQLVIALLAFFLLWAFLPENPDQFFISDFANWAYRNNIPMNTIEGLFTMKKFFGYALIVSAGISVYIVYQLSNRQVNQGDLSMIKNLSCVNTIYTTYAAWYILQWPILFMVIDLIGEMLFELGEDAFLAVVVILGIVLAIWLIYEAVKLQKGFNHSIVPSDEVVVNMSSMSRFPNNRGTRNCPYCGEVILAAAKKCKHCGEWIKEEDTKTPKGQINCPTCGESINASNTICPYCHESLSKNRNAFEEKMQRTSVSSSQAAKKNNGKLFLILGVIVFIVCLIILLRKNKNNDANGIEGVDNDIVLEEEQYDKYRYADSTEVYVEESYPSSYY